MLLIFKVSAQETGKFTKKDTLIYFNELTFNSSEEKMLFEKILNNQSDDYFSSMYMVKKGVDLKGLKSAKLKLKRQIEDLKSKKIGTNSEKKIIKKIYKDVHDEFFNKYQLNNHFDDVFTKGYYNCLSSSFLYSLVLEELNIPFQINVLPNHVNLTAYPNTHNILLETTDPVKGYFSFDNKFKEQYVNNLIAYKIIDKSEKNFISIDELFDQYYNTNQVVSIKELVGAQYYNDGLYLLREENFIQAIQQLEKSIALYPSINAGRVLISLYLNELIGSDYSDNRHFQYLAKYVRYKELKIDVGYLDYAFESVAKHHLLNKKDTIFFKTFYEKIDSISNDSIVSKRLHFFYLGAMGEYYFNSLEYNSAAEYFLRAVNLKEDTLGLLNLHVKSAILYVNDFSNKKKALDYLNKVENGHEQLEKNKLLMSYKAEIICLLMIRKFESNDPKSGEIYREQLEFIFDNIDVKINEHNVGIAYAQAGSCYFRKGNRAKAKVLLKKGLIYSPENYELESRLKMISY